MRLLQFRGRIVPRGRILNFSEPRTVHCNKSGDSEAFGLPLTDFKMAINIVDSIVTIDCEIEDYKDEHFNQIALQANKCAHALVDLAAFHEGGGWRFTLDEVAHSPDAWQPIKVANPSLKGICTAYDLADLDNAVALTEEPGFMVVLHDITQAGVLADYVVVNSARAVEGVKHLVSPGEISDTKKWEALRNALNIDRTYIDLITDTSRKPRHGEWHIVPAPVSDQVCQRAWQIVNRYMEYRLRGSHPLTAPSFPRLEGEPASDG